MDQLLDLDRYPLDDLEGPAAQNLIDRCRKELEHSGATSLEGLIRPDGFG